MKSLQTLLFVVLSSLPHILFGQSYWDMDSHQVRNLINDKIMAVPAEKTEVKTVLEREIKRADRITPVRIYIPNDNETSPIILLVHGGAWVAGNLDTHDNLARYFCHHAEAVVISVGYLNSPEGKFPLPLEQSYDALLWIVEHAKEFHADAKRVAIVGDSAGGNMAAALCLMARDRTGPSIDLQVLINPLLDLTGGGIMKKQGDNLDNIRWFATQYVADAKDVNNPYVSPALAKDLSHLPRTLVLLAEKDDLRADGQRYADQLKAAGVLTNVYIQWGIGHLAGDGARASKCALESLDVAIAALRGVFRPACSSYQPVLK